MSSIEKIEYTKKELPKKIQTIGLILFIVGLVLSIVSYSVDSNRSAFNNIIMMMMLASVGAGSFFLVALEYVAGAVWSVPFRRAAEFFSSILIILPIVALPLFFNLGHIFHWMHPEIVKMDEVLIKKAPYLNQNFLIIRFIVFILIWVGFYYFITKNSVKQDSTGDQNLTTKNIKLSAIFMPLFAFSLTFFSFDWLMSLAPHWFSTIFGVYYFSGTVLAALAVVTIAVILMNQKGYLVKGLNQEHYYSLGALLFAFTNFWAYIAFSQYMLIWYANLPEETSWFLMRWTGDWKVVSIGLILIRFLIPYAGLLSQPSKMNPKRLVIMSGVILFAHFYDLYWMIMPTYSKDSVLFSWNELGFAILTAGIIILAFVIKARKNNHVPIGDPKLQRGIDFRL